MNNEIAELQNIASVATEFIVNYGFQFIGAIIILLLGWQVAKWVAGLVYKVCQRAHLDVTLSRFFSGLIKTLVLVFVIIIALGKFGITIAPFIAALGAVVFGSTLALQGPLSNYGSGLTIVMTRPFIVGDTIKIKGVIGVVEEIKLAYTRLSNEDEEEITIPNNQIVGEILRNSFANLIVESTIGISYKNDPTDAINTILKVLSGIPDVVTEPAPQVGVQKFADSAIEIGLRYWVPTKKYFAVMYSVNEQVYKALKAANITIPYPQQDVHLVGQDNQGQQQ